MGRNKKKILRDFIDEIPDHKLQGFPTSQKTLYKDNNLRLDMQGTTSNGEWNLQIQVNAKPKTTSLRQYAPDTIAGPVLVPQSSPFTPEKIRQALKDSCRF